MSGYGNEGGNERGWGRYDLTFEGPENSFSSGEVVCISGEGQDSGDRLSIMLEGFPIGTAQEGCGGDPAFRS